MSSLDSKDNACPWALFVLIFISFELMSKCTSLLGPCSGVLTDSVEGEGNVKSRCTIIEFWIYMKAPKIILVTDKEVSQMF
jgi:hypothetical protein